HPLLFLFIFRLLRPPRPTLFPYTTLFRSMIVCQNLAYVLGNPIAHLPGPQVPYTPIPLLQYWPIVGPLIFNQGPLVYASVLATADRKSTRLNSSHGSISYAVFCLKKKTKS